MLLRALLVAAAAALAFPLLAQSDPSLPHLAHKDGRHALLVDGAPYLILGAQMNNSSAWPAELPKVWPVIEALHANTLEAPVYWEQMEPRPGQYDFSTVDLLLAQAREHGVHLVLLWFATWKNGSPGYTPAWIKLDHSKYPYLLGKDGKRAFSIPATDGDLRALDAKAFAALMRHLREADGAQHTVLLVQVENESGVWGAARDYSPASNKLFAQPVPREIAQAMGKSSSGSWAQLFGDDADEFFQAWQVATYINEVAQAGKREYPLPMYANAALKDPLKPSRPPSFESGGPTDDVLPIWKAAAPAIDLLAPDIYQPEYAAYSKVLALYARSDNPLLIPETGNAAAYPRYFFASLGAGALGWSPFGMDQTGYANYPVGAPRVDAEMLAPFALNYAIARKMDRELAAAALDGRIRGASEPPDVHEQTLPLPSPRWRAVVSYGLPAFYTTKPAPGNSKPEGGAVVVQLGDDEFLVAGVHCRVDFEPVTDATGPGKPQRLWAVVEEGSYVNGTWKRERIWNGDQTDYGLNFTSEPQVLRIKLATF